MIDFSQILPNLYIGTYPQSFDDIQHLKDCCGITAVLNLQSDEDLLFRGIDWQGMEIFYRNLGIETYRVPMQDFDHDDQQQRLPDVVSVLAGLLAADHIVYLHCNAGVGRSPLVAMAYLSWYLNMSREEAIRHVKERRLCWPFEDLLEVSRGETSGSLLDKPSHFH
jgi:hypothetical protein